MPRPLPTVPRPEGEPTTSQGQSRIQGRGRANVERATDEMRALELGETRGLNDSFFLKQLHTFKGQYDVDAITEWIEKIQMLKEQLWKAHMDEKVLFH